MLVLVHSCCGPCSIPVVKSLQDAGHEPVGFFFNPNIHPLTEYMRRREGAIASFARLGAPLILADTLPAEEQGWGEPDGKNAPAMDALHPFSPPAPEEADQEEVPGGALPEGGKPERRKTAEASLPLAMRPETWLAGALRYSEGRDGGRCVFCWRVRLRKTAAVAVDRGFDVFTSTLLFSRYQDHRAIRKLGEDGGRDFGIPFHYQDWRDCWQTSVARCREWGIYRQQYCGCVFSEYDRYRRDFRKTLDAGKNPAKGRDTVNAPLHQFLGKR